MSPPRSQSGQDGGSPEDPRPVLPAGRKGVGGGMPPDPALPYYWPGPACRRGAECILVQEEKGYFV